MADFLHLQNVTVKCFKSMLFNIKKYISSDDLCMMYAFGELVTSVSSYLHTIPNHRSQTSLAWLEQES